MLILHKKRQAALFEKAFEKHGIKLKYKIEPKYHLRSRPEYHSGKNFVRKLFELNKTPYKEELAENVLQAYKEMRRNPAYLANMQKLVPGVEVLLRRARKKGIKLAIVSNANPVQANYLLEKYSLKKYFDIIVDDSCGLPEKPSPAKLQFVIEKFGVLPKDVIMIEDSVAGIGAALTAGIVPIGVLTGVASKSNLKKAKARHVFDSVTEIKKLI